MSAELIAYSLLFHRKDTEGEGWTDNLAWPANVSVVEDDWFDWKYRIPGTGAYSLDSLAYERFKKGAEFLRQGRVVILDRLHGQSSITGMLRGATDAIYHPPGHILGTLLGIPHIVVDNRISKLSAYYNSWTSKCQLARLAGSPEEAHDLALKYLEGVLYKRTAEMVPTMW